jgi:hypothetical protein
MGGINMVKLTICVPCHFFMTSNHNILLTCFQNINIILFNDENGDNILFY